MSFTPSAVLSKYNAKTVFVTRQFKFYVPSSRKYTFAKNKDKLYKYLFRFPTCHFYQTCTYLHDLHLPTSGFTGFPFDTTGP